MDRNYSPYMQNAEDDFLTKLAEFGLQPKSQSAMMGDKAGLPPERFVSPLDQMDYLKSREAEDTSLDLTPEMLARKNRGSSGSWGDEEAPQAQGAGMPPLLAQQMMGMAGGGKPAPSAGGGAPQADKDPAVEAYVRKQLGWGNGLEDEDLKAAQDSARSNRMATGIFQALDAGASTMTGQQASTGLYDGLMKQAGQGAQDIKEGRVAKGQKMDLDEKTRAYMTKMDEEEPNSAVNQKFRKDPALLKEAQKIGMEIPKNFTVAEYKRNAPLWAELHKAREGELNRQNELDKVSLHNQKEGAKGDLERQKDERTRYVQGVGYFKTADDRQKFTEKAETAMGALDGINELKKIAGTDWKSISPKQRALADQQIIIMTGLLRQELTGPGVLSDSDKEQIRQVIGDPTKIVSLDDINLEKLNRLETRLKKGLQNSAKLRLERGDDASPQQKAPAGDIVSIKTPDGRTLRVPKSNLQKMKDEGLPFEVMNGQI